ncbi:MAG: XRE family transcriptional regulator [Elusimicrobia bacterium]|nr:XRE family transcriptional regulator [Elusimicrobiota bacterium]
MRGGRAKRLEAKGWRVGSARDFLGLTEAEAALIELKLRLARSLRAKRLAQGLGQVQAAKLLGSSQSRVAKMEAADASVSLDLLVRSHLALGTSGPELGRIMGATAR